MNKKLKETGNPAKIRRLNRDAVLSYVRVNERTSRAELIKALNLAPATVSVIVGELIADGLLVENGLRPADKRNPGRPSREIKLNSSAAYVIGLVLRIEHGVLSVDTAWSDYSGSARSGPTVVVEPEHSVESIVDGIMDALKRVRQEFPQTGNIISLCVGIPGVVSGDDVQFSPNLQCIEGRELYEQLSVKVDCPITYENDVNLVVVSELQANSRLRSLNFSYLFISQGVGAGTALHGELWKSSGWSGEIGQLEVPFEGTNSRKLEWVIGMDGFIADKAQESGINLDEFLADPKKYPDDSPINQMVDTYVHYLALAIQVLNASFDLDEVIIGESSESIISYCMPRLSKILQKSPLEITISLRGSARLSCVEGAALLALQRSLENLEDRKTA